MNGKRNAPPGQVRIIGGRWRGTRLQVPAREGLRPTSDRVRETLFNWLQPVIARTRVLDLFAGSGALGLEAASRGAAEVVLVERDAALAQALRETVARLDAADRVRVVHADALEWLRGQDAGGFDLAFVDPPFAAGLWPAVWELLPAAMAVDGWIYAEGPAESPLPAPPGFIVHREGGTRQVRYALHRRVTLATGTDAGSAAHR